MFRIAGGRGDIDDSLFDSKTPTMFVVGQFANMCNVDDLEDLREKMKAENSLLVVGGEREAKNNHTVCSWASK